MMKEFRTYKQELEKKESIVDESKRRNQEWRNLTSSEKRGLKK